MFNTDTTIDINDAPTPPAQIPTFGTINAIDADEQDPSRRSINDEEPPSSRGREGRGRDGRSSRRSKSREQDDAARNSADSGPKDHAGRNFADSGSKVLL